jgi:glycosyltransferase involved in cell wall biosynthesis
MQKYGLDVPIEVIPNPMPLSDSGFKPDEAPREKKEKSIVYMGRLSREKDVDKVLEAYAHIRALKGKDVRLVIIGDGPRREELEGRAAELGIAEGVTFTGFLRGKELADELRRHDVFVTASKSENMPVSVLEAMASGLPVVAVAALGMREIVREGVNGFLAPPDDTQSIAEHLLKIISDPILRKKFALASSELALLHDPALIATRHEELYMNLAKARNKKITDFARDASI